VKQLVEELAPALGTDGPYHMVLWAGSPGLGPALTLKQLKAVPSAIASAVSTLAAPAWQCYKHHLATSTSYKHQHQAKASCVHFPLPCAGERAL